MGLMKYLKESEEWVISEIAEMLEKAGDSKIIWTMGIDEGEVLLRRLTRRTELALTQMAENGKTPFDHIIRLQGPSLISNKDKKMSWKKVAMAIAEELGMQVEKDYSMLMTLAEEEEEDANEEKEEEERQAMALLTWRIHRKLASTKYLLVLEDLLHPIMPSDLEKVGLPLPNPLVGNRWLISTPSGDVCKESKFLTDFIFVTHELRWTEHAHWIPESVLLDEELGDIASSISHQIHHYHDDDDDGKKLFSMVKHCVQYCLLFSPVEGVDGNDNQEKNALACGLQQEELVRYWVADGLITTRVPPAFSLAPTKMTQRPPQEHEEEMDDASSLFNTGKALLEELFARSLLQLRASPSITVTATAAIWRGIDYPEIPGDWKYLQGHLFDIEEWRNSDWVSFIYSRGKTFTRFWPLGEEVPPTLTTLILRGCSQLHCFPDVWLQCMPSLRVLDLSYTPLAMLPASLSRLTNLRLLSLKGCHDLGTLTPSPPSTSSDLLPSPLQALEKLEALDLNGTPLDHIPNEVGARKHCLRYLDLSCPNIKSLPPSLFSDMQSLEELLLNHCTALADPLPSLEAMTNLRVLSLTETQITILPDMALGRLQRLRLLHLSSNHHLASLPESLSWAQGLEEIHLHDCRSIKEIKAINSAKLRIFSLSNIPCLTALPEWLSKAQGLEELRIKECKALKEIVMLGSSSLKSFSFSGSPTVQLISLRACQQLETIDLDDLPNLETLDLSACGFREIPAQILKLPKLRRLVLLGMKRLRSFPWDKIKRLPMRFSLNQCSCDDHKSVKQLGDSDDSKAYIRVGDSRIFRSLGSMAALRLIATKDGLKQFHVCVSPCSDAHHRHLDQKGSGSSLYKDVYTEFITAKLDVAKLLRPRRLEKHVEITRISRRPVELKNLVSHAESLFLEDDEFDANPTALNTSSRRLKACQLVRCHNMRTVFDSMSDALERLWASDLRRLIQVSREYPFARRDFLGLKCVHLEYCPRLEKLVPRSMELPNLERLSIKFCSNLKAIFFSSDSMECHPPATVHPSLQSICLLDLPRLKYFQAQQQVRLPAWKELKVRGCPSFQRLPLLGYPQLPDQTSIATTSSSAPPAHASPQQVISVSGELSWWNNLLWDDEGHRYCKDRCFHFKPQLPIAAIKHGMKKRPLV